jgi:hypothetical protein
MALVPLSIGGNKMLAKLTILSFVNSKPYIIPAGPPFIAMYNPSTFTTQHSQSLVEKPATDGVEATTEFKRTINSTITVSLILDATGASPGGGLVGATLSKVAKTIGGVDVLIASFFATTQSINPKSHKPNLLRLIWGAGLFFECTLESASVTYNLFDRTGRPLRATISATFKQTETPTSLAKIKNFFSSPDVTKTYVVKAGDTLCNLAQSEYGDESLYLQIAEANDLKNYRKLEPGQTLIFPPINKNEEVEE